MKMQASSPIGGPTISIDLPDIDKCPICHHSIETIVIAPATYVAAEQVWGLVTGDLQVLLRCPRPPCHRLFIARYTTESNQTVMQQGGGRWQLIGVEPRVHMAKQFDAEVAAVSPRFVEIYNQASAAEHAGLDQICGPGYRKALEFLVKDFLKSFAVADIEKSTIERAPLGTCIARIEYPKLKTAASRATWIGNDETHYVRKWEDQDLTDLKKLINLTVHWVTAEVVTAELLISMPDQKAAKAE